MVQMQYVRQTASKIDDKNCINVLYKTSNECTPKQRFAIDTFIVIFTYFLAVAFFSISSKSSNLIYVLDDLTLAYYVVFSAARAYSFFIIFFHTNFVNTK